VDFMLRLISEETGQGTVEYLVILSAAVVGAVSLARQILTALDGGMVRLGAQLEQDLKTGRTPLGIWKN
jgi:Flp pilus assembly pilin Flp